MSQKVDKADSKAESAAQQPNPCVEKAAALVRMMSNVTISKWLHARCGNFGVDTSQSNPDA
jgi:hypothetical protein